MAFGSQLTPDGFNVYKNNSFVFVVNTNDEEDVKRHIKDYVKINNFNLSDYSYKRFENHNCNNFQMRRLREQS